VTIAADVDACGENGCWCCGGEYAASDLVTLGAHPEVHVCVDCARSLHDAPEVSTTRRVGRPR
jgi:hypothetical protein